MTAAARRRVLAVRLDRMGDVLVCGPAVRAIAARADVEFLASPAGRAAARLLPGVGRVHVWDAPWISDPAPDVRAGSLRQLVRLLHRRRFGEAVVFTSFHQSPLPFALVARLAGIRAITGASVAHPGSLLDTRLLPGETLDDDIPEPERALAIAAAAGYARPAGDDGRLRVCGAEPAGVPALDGLRYVVVHPGVSAPARAWLPQRFAETVRGLRACGLPVAVTGSEEERALTAQVAGEDGIDLGGRLSLPRLAGLLAGAAALVAANTGPAHLAAAVGTPVVSLFAPVLPAVRWAPYGVPGILLGDQHAACAGTRARVCPVPGHPCLGGVASGDAVAACLRLAGLPARSVGTALPVSSHGPRQLLGTAPRPAPDPAREAV